MRAVHPFSSLVFTSAPFCRTCSTSELCARAHVSISASEAAADTIDAVDPPDTLPRAEAAADTIDPLDTFGTLRFLSMPIKADRGNTRTGNGQSAQGNQRQNGTKISLQAS